MSNLSKPLNMNSTHCFDMLYDQLIVLKKYLSYLVATTTTTA